MKMMSLPFENVREILLSSECEEIAIEHPNTAYTLYLFRKRER